eukprot:IDg8683t1
MKNGLKPAFAGIGDEDVSALNLHRWADLPERTMEIQWATVKNMCTKFIEASNMVARASITELRGHLPEFLLQDRQDFRLKSEEKEKCEEEELELRREKLAFERLTIHLRNGTGRGSGYLFKEIHEKPEHLAKMEEVPIEHSGGLLP